MDQNNVGLPGGQPEQVPGQVPGDQEQAPVPPPPTVEQLAQVIQAMDQRMQQLSVEAEATRLTHAQKLREAGCKAMARMPKFSGEGTFRTFRLEYVMWLKVNRIEEIPDEDFKKVCPLKRLPGQGDGHGSLRGPEQPIFRTSTFEQFGNKIAQIFQPEAESAMARVEFAQRKQNAKEKSSVC